MAKHEAAGGRNMKGDISAVLILFNVITSVFIPLCPIPIQILDNPSVISTSPANGEANVSIYASISVTFSKEMNKSSAETAFTIYPSGRTWSYSWNGNTMTSTPSSSLDLGTKYTVTILNWARDLQGNRMNDSYEFSFTTATSESFPPTIKETIPGDGESDVEWSHLWITAVFSQVMNHSSLEKSFSITPNVKGRFQCDDTPLITTMDFICEDNLQKNTLYTVRISTSARSVDGKNMLKDYTFSFRTSAREDYGNLICGIFVTLIIIVILVIVLMVLMRRDKALRNEIVGYLKTYRRISISELAIKCGKDAQKTERLVNKAIRKGLLKGYIDPQTKEFISDDYWIDSKMVETCPKCTAVINKRIPRGERADCDYCGFEIIN